MADPWAYCRGCGHVMLLHDVEDMDGGNPSCCVEGCNQRCGDTGSKPSGPDA